MQTITKATYQKRIKSYTRKLAEIESFIERNLSLNLDNLEPTIVIHKYWNKQ